MTSPAPTPESAPEPPAPQRTPLFDLHRELGGRLVDFAGWELPIQFDGVVAEHTWCRTAAGLFDVSHMGVVELRGPEPAAALERLTPAAITSLVPDRMRYGVLTNETGGIIDDFMVSNLGDHLMLVLNASRRSVDVAHLRSGLPALEVIERPDMALLALQGPRAVEALVRLQPAAAELAFLDIGRLEIDGISALISRSGYTGEDGFELAVPADAVEHVARRLLEQPEVRPCGLGARDTLRLEAGLCLYGHDLDETTSPVEADLVWTMPKRRRESGDFVGAERVLAELTHGPRRIRVGLAPHGRRPVRDGAVLRTADGEPAGIVTSGGYGPTVERPVAMGYVVSAHGAIDTTLLAEVRGSQVPITVAPLPFSPHHYRRRPS